MCQPSTPYRLQDLSLAKILKGQLTTARSKVKSRSHYDVAHLLPLTYVPTKYQLLYGSERQPRQTFQTNGHLDAME